MPTAAQRKAQSDRDKALAKNQKMAKNPSGGPGPGRGRRRQRGGNPNANVGPYPAQPIGVEFPTGRTTNLRGKRSDVVEFDEYVAEINGSTNFATTKYPINPGVALTFPEGSVEAQLWTEWQMDRCVFYYKPEVSAYATQGQNGKLILAVDYNAANATPTTKQQVELMDRADCMPSKECALSLDPACVNRSDAKYVRTGAVPPGTDIKTYDGGNLWVSTYGQTNGNVIGELRVRYRFRVGKPTLLNAGAVAAQTSASFFQSSVPESSGATTVAKNVAFATAGVNGLGAVNTAGSIVIPVAGTYLVNVSLSGEVTGGNVPTVVADIQLAGVSAYAEAATRPKVDGSIDTTDSNEFWSLSAVQMITVTAGQALTVPVTVAFAGGTSTLWGAIAISAVA